MNTRHINRPKPKLGEPRLPVELILVLSLPAVLSARPGRTRPPLTLTSTSSLPFLPTFQCLPIVVPFHPRRGLWARPEPKVLPQHLVVGADRLVVALERGDVVDSLAQDLPLACLEATVGGQGVIEVSARVRGEGSARGQGGASGVIRSQRPE